MKIKFTFFLVIFTTILASSQGVKINTTQTPEDNIPECIIELNHTGQFGISIYNKICTNDQYITFRFVKIINLTTGYFHFDSFFAILHPPHGFDWFFNDYNLEPGLYEFQFHYNINNSTNNTGKLAKIRFYLD